MGDGSGEGRLTPGEEVEILGGRYVYTAEHTLVAEDGEVLDLRQRSPPFSEVKLGHARYVQAVADNWIVVAAFSGIVGNRADAVLRASFRRLRRAARQLSTSQGVSLWPQRKRGTRALGQAMQDVAIEAFQARMAELDQDVPVQSLRATAWTGGTWPPGAVVLYIDGGSRLSGRVVVTPGAPPERQIEVIVRMVRAPGDSQR